MKRTRTIRVPKDCFENLEELRISLERTEGKKKTLGDALMYLEKDYKQRRVKL